jgi:hypothetical protein
VSREPEPSRNAPSSRPSPRTRGEGARECVAERRLNPCTNAIICAGWDRATGWRCRRQAQRPGAPRAMRSARIVPALRQQGLPPRALVRGQRSARMQGETLEIEIEIKRGGAQDAAQRARKPGRHHLLEAVMLPGRVLSEGLVGMRGSSVTIIFSEQKRARTRISDSAQRSLPFADLRTRHRSPISKG